MRRLVGHGASVDAVALDDWTPLTQAAESGALDAVRFLIASGANVNKPSGDLSPLYFASDKDHIEVVRLLLKNGAKLTLPEAGRSRFLQEIKNHHDPELLKLLAGQLPQM